MLWGLLCFAAGNSHRTEAALKGQQVYFQRHEKASVAVVADKVAKSVRHEDAHVIGVRPEVLNAAVAAEKANPSIDLPATTGKD